MDYKNIVSTGDDNGDQWRSTLREAHTDEMRKDTNENEYTSNDFRRASIERLKLA
jgi:hypothetical protein